MTENRIGLLGGNGFVGNAIGKSISVDAPSRKDVDITSTEQLESWVRTLKSDTIVLAAAYTNTKTAQSEPKKVYEINVEGVRAVAQVAEKLSKRIICLSTGFVFTGEEKNPGPYNEMDDPQKGDPTFRGVYASSKLQGEKVLQEILGDKSVIIRIDFPFGNTNFPDKDFALKLLGFIKKGGSLYGDQYITPTYIPDLINAIKIVSQNKLNGIFHVASPDVTTPYDFGIMIVDKLGLPDEIKSSKFPYGNVLMPKFGGLDTNFTQEILGLNLLTIDEALEGFLCSPLTNFFVVSGK